MGGNAESSLSGNESVAVATGQAELVAADGRLAGFRAAPPRRTGSERSGN